MTTIKMTWIIKEVTSIPENARFHSCINGRKAFYLNDTLYILV